MRIPKSQNGEMPFLDHLEELRWRIIYSLAAVVICVGVGFWVTLRFDLVKILAGPILPLLPEHHLFFTHPSDKFSISLNTAMTCGLVLAAPIVLYQVWLFLAPALHKHEKRVAIGVLFSGTALFIAGAVLALAALGLVTPLFLLMFRRPPIVMIVRAAAVLAACERVWWGLALAVPLY